MSYCKGAKGDPAKDARGALLTGVVEVLRYIAGKYPSYHEFFDPALAGTRL